MTISTFLLVIIIGAAVGILILILNWAFDRKKAEPENLSDLQEKKAESKAGRSLDEPYQNSYGKYVNPPMTDRSKPNDSNMASTRPVKSVDDRIEDDGFASSMMLGMATGMPIGTNPAGALLGAMMHDDGSNNSVSQEIDHSIPDQPADNYYSSQPESTPDYSSPTDSTPDYSSPSDTTSFDNSSSPSFDMN